MSWSSGLSDSGPPVCSCQANLALILLSTYLRDERMSQPCPTPGSNVEPVAWQRKTVTTALTGFLHLKFLILNIFGFVSIKIFKFLRSFSYWNGLRKKNMRTSHDDLKFNKIFHHLSVLKCRMWVLTQEKKNVFSGFIKIFLNIHRIFTWSREPIFDSWSRKFLVLLVLKYPNFQEVSLVGMI